MLHQDVPGFTLDEWQRAVERANELMKQSNGHSYMTTLKTRCQYCGRSPRDKRRCGAWANTLISRILFVLLNKEQELAGRVAPPTEEKA